jgi:hypothetical protein
MESYRRHSGDMCGMVEPMATMKLADMIPLNQEIERARQTNPE